MNQWSISNRETVVAVCLSLIYMAPLGVDNAFESVDAVWAEQQHDLWYEGKLGEQHRKPHTP